MCGFTKISDNYTSGKHLNDARTRIIIKRNFVFHFHVFKLKLAARWFLSAMLFCHCSFIRISTSRTLCMSFLFRPWNVLVSLTLLASLSTIGCAQSQDTAVRNRDKNGPPIVKQLKGAPVTIVKDGASAAPIIVFADAPPMIVQAAQELATYIEKTSGAKPEIINGLPNPIPATAIWVGYQPALKTIFPDIDFTFHNPEEILLAAGNNNIVIAGRDIWFPDNMVIKGKRYTINGKQLEYGTPNAVYTFIQDKLNVRWFWPGKVGEDIDHQKTLTFEPFTYRYHPQMRARGGLIHYSSLLRGGYGTSDDWVRLQRLTLDSFTSGGGHGFGNWWNLYHETHPEYFALQPDGTRSGYPKPGYAKICQSNPAVWDQWIKNVEEAIKKDPTQIIFNASANDGYSSGVCVCDNCRAWDDPNAEKFNYIWSGAGQSYVAMSDRDLTFANHLADKLKERFPGKDYYVMLMAYGFSRPVPLHTKAAPNVITPYVGHIPWAKHLVEQEENEFAGWAAAGEHPMFYRPNTGSQFGWQQGLPEVMLQDTIAQFAFLRDHNNAGIFIDAVWEHWGTQAPQYYLMTQLTWNPYADGHKVLDDFYDRGFGPASKYIRLYWQVMEDARNAYLGSEQTQIGMERLAAGYTDQVMKDAKDQLLLAALAVAGSEDQKYKGRVAFVTAGFDRSKLFIDTIPMMTQYQEGGRKDEKLAQQVRDMWTQMDAITKEYPYVVNSNAVRPGTPRMRGTHPDFLPKMASGEGGASVMVQVNQITSKELPTYKSAQDAGWKLVFEDNFDRKEIGDKWKPAAGNWAIEDGQLVGSDGFILTANPININGKASFQRIEFDAITAVAGMDAGDLTNVRVCDISPMMQIHLSDDPKASTLQSGYFMQFGGYWNKRNQVRQSGVSILVDNDPKIVIKVGVKQHIVAENDYGHLKLFVDGKIVYHTSLKATIVGTGYDLAGIYLTTPSKIDNVKIYAKVYESGLDTE